MLLVPADTKASLVNYSPRQIALVSLPSAVREASLVKIVRFLFKILLVVINFGLIEI